MNINKIIEELNRKYPSGIMIPPNFFIDNNAICPESPDEVCLPYTNYSGEKMTERGLLLYERRNDGYFYFKNKYKIIGNPNELFRVQEQHRKY
jgi:hypothetical protein